MHFKNNKYKEIEKDLLKALKDYGDDRVGDTIELMNVSFTLNNNGAFNNRRSNYKYAKEFFKWIKSGDTDLTDKLKKMNPHAQKFVDTTNLPENFSSSYGWKIKKQLPDIIDELKRNPNTRRAYLSILLENDKVILGKQTTHEFPCTIGIQFLLRNCETELCIIVNMRSNNVWNVLPYDVYNFTQLQDYIATKLGVRSGEYMHTVNSLHIYKRDLKDINRYLEQEHNESLKEYNKNK